MTIKNIPDDETGAAIRQWAESGSDLTKPMKIDFLVAVPTEEVGKGFSVSPEP